MNIEEIILTIETHLRASEENRDEFKEANMDVISLCSGAMAQSYKTCLDIIKHWYDDEFKCSICDSNKTYKTEAYHCTNCATTTEI